jgi:multiple sugar transport system ATP-binding protein
VGRCTAHEEDIMSSISLHNVWKLYGDQAVVKNLSLEARDGEFLVLVGASGCGKSTTLRMLAGLETPTYGSIKIDDDDVTLVKPGNRDVAMVFQSYALYPHMTVYKNMAFGPLARREPKTEVHKRVVDVSRTLGLEQYLHRHPSELSGGQRQRVALGRVMIRHPRLSLLDEPLSNLDAALRVQMRMELVRLQKELQVTTVYVTHDQIEAMTMGDRIAVLDQGVLAQMDTPEILYDEPATEFVATFIGSPKMNVNPGVIASSNGSLTLSFLGIDVPIDQGKCELAIDQTPAQVRAGIRPHDLFLADESPARCTVRFTAVVDLIEVTGAEGFAIVQPAGADTTVEIRVPRAFRVTPGMRIKVAFDPQDIHLFSPDTGERIIRWRGPRIQSATEETDTFLGEQLSGVQESAAAAASAGHARNAQGQTELMQ